jgi:hypothetical protein
MGIGDKMSGFANSTREGVKSSTLSFMHICLRLITGVFLGLVLSLIGQELLSYGSFALIFVIVVVMSLVMKFMSGWSMGKILIFDLICVLMAMLLRMYILVAP